MKRIGFVCSECRKWCSPSEVESHQATTGHTRFVALQPSRTPHVPPVSKREQRRRQGRERQLALSTWEDDGGLIVVTAAR